MNVTGLRNIIKWKSGGAEVRIRVAGHGFTMPLLEVENPRTGVADTEVVLVVARPPGTLATSDLDALKAFFKDSYSLGDAWDSAHDDVGAGATPEEAMRKVEDNRMFRLARTLGMVDEKWIAALQENLTAKAGQMA